MEILRESLLPRSPPWKPTKKQTPISPFASSRTPALSPAGGGILRVSFRNDSSAATDSILLIGNMNVAELSALYCDYCRAFAPLSTFKRI